MLDDLKYNTATVNPEAENLISCANEFSSVIDSLVYIGNQIQTNWEGDGADINGILDSINNAVNSYETKIIPAMSKLGNGMLAFSDALDEITKATIDQAVQQAGDLVDAVAGATTGVVGAATGAIANVFDSQSGSADASSSSDGGRSALSKRKWGEWNTFSGDYWDAVGQDFAENWDYSNCDSGMDYVWKTVGGVGSTLVDIGETGLEIITDIPNSLFSAIGNGLEEVWNWFF